MLLNPIQSRALFDHALANGYAVLAVNADSHSAVRDCLEAARQCDAPVIIEASLWQLEGHGYGAGDAVLGMARYLADLAVLADAAPYRAIPVVFHTDHIKGPKTIDILGAGIRGIRATIGGHAIVLHPSTISLDASGFTDQQNIDAICRLAAIAGEAGVDVTLEMESAVDKGVTPPEVTRRLIGSVEAAHPGSVCLYAPGLGTKHGFSADGYPEFGVQHVQANVRLLRELTGRSVGLALHGSTGLSHEDLAAAAAAGVVKVNWSTESLHIRSQAALDYYVNNTARFDKKHPEWKSAVMDNAVQQHVASAYIPRVAERMRILGSAGRAPVFVATL